MFIFQYEYEVSVLFSDFVKPTPQNPKQKSHFKLDLLIQNTESTHAMVSLFNLVVLNCWDVVFFPFLFLSFPFFWFDPRKLFNRHVPRFWRLLTTLRRPPRALSRSSPWWPSMSQPWTRSAERCWNWRDRYTPSTGSAMMKPVSFKTLAVTNYYYISESNISGNFNIMLSVILTCRCFQSASLSRP